MSNWKTVKESAPMQKAIRKAFEETDIDGNGTIDFKELYIALLRVYDKMNAKLPAHVKAPSIKEVERLMKKFDKDANGVIGFEEFRLLALTLLFSKKDLTESLAFKISMALIIKMIIIPLVALFVKNQLMSAGVDKAGDVPTVLLSNVIEIVVKALFA